MGVSLVEVVAMGREEEDDTKEVEEVATVGWEEATSVEGEQGMVVVVEVMVEGVVVDMEEGRVEVVDMEDGRVEVVDMEEVQEEA